MMMVGFKNKLSDLKKDDETNNHKANLKYTTHQRVPKQLRILIFFSIKKNSPQISNFMTIKTVHRDCNGHFAYNFFHVMISSFTTLWASKIVKKYGPKNASTPRTWFGMEK